MFLDRRVSAIQIAFVLLASAVLSRAQPPDAFIVERAPIPTNVHANRELVLWMVSPTKHDRGPYSDSNFYSCPEFTMGSHYSGPTRISLIDTSAKRTINTVNLTYNERDEDSFDIPYRILGGLSYPVPGHDDNSEGKPALMVLRDLNGDGLALEAAFFEAETCMGLQTTLFGYSSKQDRVIQYRVELKQRGQKTRTAPWIDYLFSEPPESPGHWSNTIDYSGRGGCQDSYQVRYDSIREKFFATLSQKHCAPDP
jgi:hypothetical protein